MLKPRIHFWPLYWCWYEFCAVYICFQMQRKKGIFRYLFNRFQCNNELLAVSISKYALSNYLFLTFTWKIERWLKTVLPKIPEQTFKKREEKSFALMAPFFLSTPPFPWLMDKTIREKCSCQQGIRKKSRTSGEMNNLFFIFRFSSVRSKKRREKWSQWHFLPAASYPCMTTGTKSICTSKLKHCWTTTAITTKTRIFVRRRHHFYKWITHQFDAFAHIEYAKSWH